MINTKEIKKLIECTLISAYVKNKDKSVSLFLIADAESGKSRLIETMKEYPNTIYTNDLSMKPLIEEIFPQFERGDISHILIPDFINPLSHRRASETLIPILNSLLEEGVKDLKFYGISRIFPKEIKGGLITGVTKNVFDRKILSWKENGFLSRIIPISFKYSSTTIQKIHNSIKKSEYLEIEKIEKDFKDLKLNSIEVVIPENISDLVEILSNGLCNQNKSYAINFYDESSKQMRNYKVDLKKYGFRLHKQLRTLLQGIAVYNTEKIELNKKIIVDKTDFEELKALSKFLNFDFTEI